MNVRPSQQPADEYSIAVSVQPWSMTIAVSWRTTLRFYERRYEITREIEDQLGLAAFMHDEDLVGALLPTGRTAR